MSTKDQYRFVLCLVVGRLSDAFGDEWQSIGFGHQTREIMHQTLALDTIWTFQVVSDDLIVNFAVFCSENTIERFTVPAMLGSPSTGMPEGGNQHKL